MTLALIFAEVSRNGQIVTFGAIALAGLVVLAFSALFGGHDHADHAGHDVHHDGGAHAAVSIFSPRIIAVFCVGFGAAGLIVSTMGVGLFGAIGAGLASGVVLAGIAFMALSFMYKQQANSMISGESVIGQMARVTTAIPAQGVGEVGVTVQQQYGTHIAKTKDGCAIPAGQTVKIIGRVGGVLEVERVS